MRVTVLGGGSWGTALADLLAGRGESVRLWMVEEDLAKAINEQRENPRYLPGHKLPDGLQATTDLRASLDETEAVVVVVPTPFIREVMGRARDAIPRDVPIVAASKGIENDTLMTVHQILEDVLPAHHHPYLACLSGPSFAKEVVRRQPTAVTVASWWPRVAQSALDLFTTPYFRVYTSTDLMGVEIAGALKNVIAIGAGIVDGLGFGHNTRAALITRGLAEISRLGARMGANPLTFMGLSGMGDLILTCTGELSRNRTVGVALGRGQKLDDILRDLGMVAEGVKTARSAEALGRKLGVELPITDMVYRILYEGKAAKEGVTELMTRVPKAEFY